MPRRYDNSCNGTLAGKDGQWNAQLGLPILHRSVRHLRLPPSSGGQNQDQRNAALDPDNSQRPAANWHAAVAVAAHLWVVDVTSVAADITSTINACPQNFEPTTSVSHNDNGKNRRRL